MRYILALIIAVPLLAVSLEADAGLVEDLRSGKSNVRASSTQGSHSGIIKFWREMKSQPDFKAIASARGWSYGVMGRYTAEAAVEGALQHCKESGGGVTRCEVYAVGDNIVEGRSQTELADAIEAYQLEVSGSRSTYCKRRDGTVYSYGWKDKTACGGEEEITKAEYDRLKGKKTVTARKTPTSSHYCKRKDGVVYESKRHVCPSSHTEINKAEYDRLKNQKKDAASTTKPDAASSGDDPLEAKLEKLKKLLEKGLITEEEAAAKRAKLLEDL